MFNLIQEFPCPHPLKPNSNCLDMWSNGHGHGPIGHKPCTILSIEDIAVNKEIKLPEHPAFIEFTVQCRQPALPSGFWTTMPEES